MEPIEWGIAAAWFTYIEIAAAAAALIALCTGTSGCNGSSGKDGNPSVKPNNSTIPQPTPPAKQAPQTTQAVVDTYLDPQQSRRMKVMDDGGPLGGALFTPDLGTLVVEGDVLNSAFLQNPHLSIDPNLRGHLTDQQVLDSGEVRCVLKMRLEIPRPFNSSSQSWRLRSLAEAISKLGRYAPPQYPSVVADQLGFGFTAQWTIRRGREIDWTDGTLSAKVGGMVFDSINSVYTDHPTDIAFPLYASFPDPQNPQVLLECIPDQGYVNETGIVVTNGAMELFFSRHPTTNPATGRPRTLFTASPSGIVTYLTTGPTPSSLRFELASEAFP